MTEPSEELIDWLILRHAPDLSASQLQRLLQQFGSARQIRSSQRSALLALKLSAKTIDFLCQSGSCKEIEQELRWSEEKDHEIIPFTSRKYPEQLKTIPVPPPVLYARGNASLLNEPQLAIVGSRNPTTGGRDNARQFAQHFSAAGLVITSGLALGIDGAAHEGALRNNGATIAVMATGPDRLYPAQHKKLATSILDNAGLLLTEMPLGTQPLPALFPQRNRIISGLSIGVLVVEAARRSGSLISARLAGEQGREVFAIPGSIHNPQSRGCHRLIKQGAKLVESADDILEEIAPLLRQQLESVTETNPDKPVKPALDTEYRELLAAMGHDAVTVDQLVERCNISAKEVSSMLLILELEGRIQAESGGFFTVKSS